MNPFASRFIRPGARRYQFPEKVNPESLVEQLAKQNWWGQIVGPHGSGKSTLLATLQPALESANRQLALFTLRADQVIPPREPRNHRWDYQTQVIVDGYEQLTWWQRFRLRSTCRRRRSGLLITTHQSQGLPTLWRTAPSEQLAWDLVQAMQADCSPPLVTREDVRNSFDATRGDLRETLFALYDVYEQRAAELRGPESSD